MSRFTVNDYLRLNSDKYGSKNFILSADCCYSYRETEEKTKALAKGLISIGIKNKTHVAVLVDSSPDAVLILLSLLRIGAIGVMIGPFPNSVELLDRLEYADCAYLIYSDTIRDENINPLIESSVLNYLEKAIRITDDFTHKALSLNNLYELGQSVPDRMFYEYTITVKDSDYDLMLFTSGSTGKPKGVLHSYEVRVKAAMAQLDALCVTEADIFCVALPLYHCFGMVANVVCAIVSGASLAFPRGYHTGDILECIQQYSCTIFNGVPTLFKAISSNSDFRQYDISSLRTGTIAGSKYSPLFFEEMCNTFGAEFISSYGMTETCTGVCSCSIKEPREVRANTVGPASPGLEVKIVDSQIYVHGYSVMQGYYKNAEQTKLAIDDDGWLATGDCGELVDNHLIINGRLKDIIIKAGENITPFEVESVINCIPGIVDSKVVGVPDSFRDEAICAVVKTDSNMDEDTIIRFCKDRLLKNQVPDKVVIIDEFPMTNSGKLDLVKIKEIAFSA